MPVNFPFIKAPHRNGSIILPWFAIMINGPPFGIFPDILSFMPIAIKNIFEITFIRGYNKDGIMMLMTKVVIPPMAKVHNAIG